MMDLMKIGEDALLDASRMERAMLEVPDKHETRNEFHERMCATGMLLGLTYDNRDHTFCGDINGEFKVFDADNMRDISHGLHTGAPSVNGSLYGNRMVAVSRGELGWKG